LDEELYEQHIGKDFGISRETMGTMLRCYAISCCGTYIFDTIADEKMNVIRRFLQQYGDRGFRLNGSDCATVEDFLFFIDTPDEQISKILQNIRRIKSRKSSSRRLSPIINYLVLENEIRAIYDNCPDDETFRKWFPIYFWVNITFILPLRATEMLVTPKDCIRRENGKVYLRIRRTNLKKKHRAVYYDVDKDYTEYSYEIPDTVVTRNIEKYMEITRAQDRRFLFEYSWQMVNGMLSLMAFNHLIAAFMEECIIGNHRYDFIRYASEIAEFEPVTAGDSRPIAMANLYFQKFSADICRQLADHENINTSSGYYTNISETIWASSLIQVQKRMEHQKRCSQEQCGKSLLTVTDVGRSVCVSERRQADAEDLRDCIEQGHLEECMGCKFYRPAREELTAFMEEQKHKADESAKRVLESMNRATVLKGVDVSLEELFLSVQTEASRYRMGCGMKAEEKYREWQKH
jgi:hypothetical protein